MASKVFVGNLSYDTSQTDLETLFSRAGQVTEVFLPIDRETGRPRGFAFVEFRDAAAITEAISMFDGTELQGRALKVNEARERAPRETGFGPDQRAGASAKPSRPKGSRRGIRGRKRGF